MSGTASLVRAIIARRRAADDDDRHLLGDDERDALAAVRYVRAHRRVPVEVLRDDVVDALAITERLLAEVGNEQAALIGMARAHPVSLSWQRIAVALRMKSRQGPRDRLRRLSAARDGMTDVEARGDATVRRRRAAWLATGGRAVLVRDLAGEWVRVRDLVPAAWAEDVDELGDLVDGEALAIAVRALGRQLAAVGVEHEVVAGLVERTRAVLDGFPSRR